MPGFLTDRRRQEEWMDRPDVDPEDLRRSLLYIRRINTWLPYTRSILGHLERFSHGWARGRRIDIIDLATGSGDVPQAILHWAERRGFDVRIVGLDLHHLTSRIAAEQNTDPRLRIVRGDALDPPFASGSFDYALAALFLHHLDEDDVVRVLRVMNRLARRGVIVADLLRHRRAYAWVSFFGLFARPIFAHDAKASVAQAFTRDEVIALRERAGLEYARYYRHFGHRFVLAGEKPRGRHET